MTSETFNFKGCFLKNRLFNRFQYFTVSLVACIYIITEVFWRDTVPLCSSGRFISKYLGNIMHWLLSGPDADELSIQFHWTPPSASKFGHSPLFVIAILLKLILLCVCYIYKKNYFQISLK